MQDWDWVRCRCCRCSEPGSIKVVEKCRCNKRARITDQESIGGSTTDISMHSGNIEATVRGILCFPQQQVLMEFVDMSCLNIQW